MRHHNDLGPRLVVTLVLVAPLAVGLVLAATDTGFMLLSAFLLLIVGGGVWEYAQLARAKRLAVAPYRMIAIAQLSVASMALARWLPLAADCPWLILLLGYLLCFVLRFGHRQAALACIAVECFGISYLALPAFAFLQLLPGGLLFVLIITKAADIGAYFGGKLYGKHRLAAISPRKTWEGAGWAVCTALLVSRFLAAPCQLGASEALLLAGGIAILGQLGDLAASLLKRDAKVKDSNRWLGCGGVLDVVDSLLFTLPFGYFYFR